MKEVWSLVPVGDAPTPGSALDLVTDFFARFFELDLQVQHPLEPPAYKDWPSFIAARSWQADPPVSRIIFWFGNLEGGKRWSPGVSYSGNLKVIGVFTGSLPYQRFNDDVLLHELAHVYLDPEHCHSFCILSAFASPGYYPLFHRLCGKHKRLALALRDT